MATKSTKPRRETLNLRIPAGERQLIDRAAATAGKTRTDFVLQAARKAAEETLLDRGLMVVVNPKAYSQFLALLDQPGEPNERLRRTMSTKAPWEPG